MSWELLLNDGQIVQYVNNSNIKDLLQDNSILIHNSPFGYGQYPKTAGASMVALTFAIYFAAITALGYGDESIELPLEKSVLLKRYKTILDRLLLATDLMNRPEMTALQALAIYVTCLRVHETGRSVWVLNGLAIRLAQSIGLHRDGACLQLSPFDTEMRLRLWWHLCVLDSRAPEDQGFELSLDVLNQGLRLPLNIDDNQIFPNMTQLPNETEGWTEMSFFLIQTESCRLLHPVLGTREQCSAETLKDITAKRKMIQERTQYVSNKYGISSKTPSGLSLVAIQHFTTACKKMEFMLQLREEISMRKRKGLQGDATDVLKPSFRLACEVLESNYILLKEGLSLGFKWLFTTYTQWYALAYVLRCLCSSPCGPEAERAWALVEEVFPHEMSVDGYSAGTHDEYGHGSIWKCLALLRYQALSLKHAQLPTDGEIQPPECRASQGFRVVEHRQDTEIPPIHTSAHMTSPTDFGVIHEQEFIADPNQNIFSSLDFSVSEIPFLPEWNAVINGCLDNGDNSAVL
ncbi:hypothetical protein EYZ11_010667 [Aspergillus tanneri]|uniref:Xylanolytic transcriptional activator regulatory domain-containing protein n=1 Tax=Aspergillus tanneri TaxID=1220188 RepID=A0A4S3J4S9_9EURO|nr:hypothetical protein EYZ11_010667 [Aspergillus tanneri]